ncbi:hypothetical protein D3C83_59800 [compost metagenome]
MVADRGQAAGLQDPQQGSHIWPCPLGRHVVNVQSRHGDVSDILAHRGDVDEHGLHIAQ